MKEEKHERANEIKRELAILRVHRGNLPRINIGAVASSGNPYWFGRLFKNGREPESSGYSGNKSSQFNTPMTLKLSTAGLHLYDEFMGNMEELETLYLMRLDLKIQRLEQEYEAL